jgi:hypothetical protein
MAVQRRRVLQCDVQARHSISAIALAGLAPLWSDRKTRLNLMSLSFALRRPGVRFLVGRDGTGKALATGAVILHGEWAEIKRM